MFTNLLNFWKGKDFLSGVFADFKQMLVDAHTMFETVCAKMVYDENVASLEDTVYNLDANINRLEKHIRTRIVEHLTLQPTVDISACLLLMSVVKDAERLGDYCKNLMEVTQIQKAPFNKETFSALFNGMDKEISRLFQSTREAFIESDSKKAVSTWGYETKIAKQCDEIVRKVAVSDLSVNEAVCFTLIARHFKRLVAHLTNIATSVILPINELDYYDEKRRVEHESL